MPPTKPPRRETGRNPGSLSSQLRDAITSRRLSANSVASAAGLNRRAIDRFLAGTRGLTLASADRIAAALGLRLAEAPGRRTFRRDVSTLDEIRSVEVTEDGPNPEPT